MSAKGATVFGCLGAVLDNSERDFYREADPWGFILFARNVETPEQLRRLTSDLRAAVGRDAPVFIDQEGGRVQRLRAPHWREWSPPLDTVRRAGDKAARAMHLRSRLIAAELRDVGIDGNCAPTVDIATDLTHPFLRNRCYGEDLETVVTIAREVAAGLLEGGVLPVMKHIPGHGRATMDTHLELPRVTEPAATLLSCDFAAFRALNDLPIGMTAHIVFTAYDERPATCSPVMVRVIREDIGFQGVLMTDDLSMQALSGSLAERATRARAAGCDIVLHCNGKMDEMIAVADAAVRMQPEERARADAALAWRHVPDDCDLASVDAELAALTQGDLGG